MKRLVTAALIACLSLAASSHAQPASDPLAELAARRGLPERVAVSPVKVSWTFSGDGGKTHAMAAVPPVPVHGKPPVFAAGEFNVEDPAAIGTLWLTTDSPVGAMATCDDEGVGRRYVGRVPVLLKSRVALNGTPVTLPESDDNMLLSRFGIDGALLKKGKNTLTVSGLYWNNSANLQKALTVKVGFLLSSSPADALALRGGPVLGPMGEDYFTLVARTHIPAAVQVAVKPLDPVGPARTFDFPRGTLHRLRMDVPRGTRKFQYTLTTRNGPHSQVTGPFDVRVPRAGALRFVVLGQTAANGDMLDPLVRAAEALEKLDPDFIVHTGSIVKMAYWDFEWDESFLRPWRQVLATRPIVVVPAYRDSYSMAFGRLFYHATADGGWGPWTWSIGGVRFIGMDSFTVAAGGQGPAVAQWVEGVLKDAREEYVFSVNAYAGYVTRPFGRGIDGTNYDKNVIQPLLVKYGATASLGCGGSYECVEPPAGKGVRTVMTGGVGAEMSPGWTQYHWCVFTMKDGSCEMEATAYETGKVIDRQSFPARKKQPGVAP